MASVLLQRLGGGDRYLVKVSVVYGHPEVRVAGGSYSHVVNLATSIAQVLKEKGVDYEVDLVFAGRVFVEKPKFDSSLNIKVIEADMYNPLYYNLKNLNATIQRLTRGLFSYFPPLVLSRDGVRRLREALKLSSLIISRPPATTSLSLAYWLALRLSSPRDAILVDENFNENLWGLIELGVDAFPSKIKAIAAQASQVWLTRILSCLLHDFVFTISEGGAEVILEEVPWPLKKLCKGKMIALYPPLYSKTKYPSSKEGGPFTFCTSGSFYPHQGWKELAKLIYAMNEAFDMHDKIKFKIFGAPINLYRFFKNLVGAFSNVEFDYITVKEELYKAYARECDAFLALYDPFRAYKFYGAPAKLADYVLFNKPIIIWNNEEYLKTLEALTKKCDCAIVVNNFEELLEVALKLVKAGPGECECELRERTRSEEAIEEIIESVLSRRRKLG